MGLAHADHHFTFGGLYIVHVYHLHFTLTFTYDI